MNIAARVQGLADVDEICMTEAVMTAPGVIDLVKSHPGSSDYVPLKGVDQKMDIHRMRVTHAGT